MAPTTGSRQRAREGEVRHDAIVAAAPLTDPSRSIHGPDPGLNNTAAMAILETHDLGKRYGRRTWALRHVDLEVPDGSVNLVIPGERYRFVEAREAAVLIGGSLVALLLAGLVVARRRPG